MKGTVLADEHRYAGAFTILHMDVQVRLGAVAGTADLAEHCAG
jgi:hypothetical protein